MNIRFLITATVAAISISVFAQGGKPPAGGQGKPGGQRMGGMRRGMPDELKKQLNITPAQQKKIDAIQAKYKAKFPKFTPGTRPSEADMAKFRPLMEAMRKEMDAVWTPKQKEVMKKWRDAHPRRGGPGGPGGPKPGGKTGGGGHGG